MSALGAFLPVRTISTCSGLLLIMSMTRSTGTNLYQQATHSSSCRYRHERQHQVERNQDPGDLPNLGVEFREDLRQSKRHHTGIAEHNSDGE